MDFTSIVANNISFSCISSNLSYAKIRFFNLLPYCSKICFAECIETPGIWANCVI